MNYHLKPHKFKLCPFCGSNDVLINSEDVGMEYREGYWGECNICGARGGLVENYSFEDREFSIEEATEKWNTRPIEEQLRTKLAFLTTPVGSK